MKNVRTEKTFVGHQGAITNLILLPNQQSFLTSAARDSTIKQWNLKTGELLRTFQGHKGPVIQLKLLPPDFYAIVKYPSKAFV